MLKKFLLIGMVVLTACSSRHDANVVADAERHAAVLRAHFSGQSSSMDVSTLVSQTRSISARLKQAGRQKTANKFDSYTDVLMYGNNTLDESINDVMDLVKNGYCSGESFMDLFKSH
ncbi:MAG: hypothetical protein K6C34_04605 [Alphaproteobacteria bacterium]|nr:hypothetical protein [Alphaproteobacteria bacterium]